MARASGHAIAEIASPLLNPAVVTAITGVAASVEEGGSLATSTGSMTVMRALTELKTGNAAEWLYQHLKHVAASVINGGEGSVLLQLFRPPVRVPALPGNATNVAFPILGIKGDVEDVSPGGVQVKNQVVPSPFPKEMEVRQQLKGILAGYAQRAMLKTLPKN